MNYLSDDDDAMMKMRNLVSRNLLLLYIPLCMFFTLLLTISVFGGIIYCIYLDFNKLTSKGQRARAQSLLSFYFSVVLYIFIPQIKLI